MDEEQVEPFSWRRFEFAGVAAITATLVCVFVGQAAQEFAAQVATPTAEFVKSPPHFNAIDYAATASTKGGAVVIGPCDTRRP